MTTLRIARTELERLFSSGLTRTAVLVMILVPSLLAGLYLYANHDPYDGLSRVPAAIVVQDEGAQDSDGEIVSAGLEVAAQLQSSDDFEWEVVPEKEADDGLEDGSYEFTLVIPPDFSRALVDPAEFEPDQSRLVMATNSYLAPAIVDRVADSVRIALAERVGARAASAFLIGVAEIRDNLGHAEKGARQLRDRLADAAQGSARLERRADKVIDAARDLAGADRGIASRAGSIAGVSSQLVRDYHRVRSSLIARMNRLNLTPVQRQYLLNAYTYLGQRLTLGDDAIRDDLEGLRGQASDARALTRGARGLARDSDGMHEDLVELRQGGAQLARELASSRDQGPEVDDDATARMSEAVGNPVDVRNVADTDADSYGEGLTPLFLALAAWIGGYALLLLARPLSTRALSANQSAFRVAIGGWLTPALVGALQMVLLAAVVLPAVEIAPEDVPLTLAFLLLTAVTFVAIVHCLSAWFGAAGQFLALALLAVQLVTAGGAFPWQTIPEPLHWVHHALPMSYVVDGLQQLMYGGARELAAYDAAVLVGWLVVALALTAVAARRQRTWSVKRIKPELAL